MFDTEIRTLDNGLTSYPALSVSPIGLTAYRLSVDNNGQSPLKAKGIKPPIQNQEKGFLSKKGQKAIRNAVYWFLYSVDKDLIIKGTAKNKVGFLTLTLPSVQIHSDKEIKKKCLNQFLTELRNEYDVKKYIWKGEKQDNGNIHFHLLTDTFLPVIEMRDKWNRIINKLGYVYSYSQKMRKISWVNYLEMRMRKNDPRPVRELKKIYLKAYKKGVKEKWKNPNSIDIESLRKVKNVGAYIGKYMSKEHKGKGDKSKLSVDGRLWFSSSSVSKMKNLLIEAFEPEFYEFVDMLAEANNEKSIYETEYTTTLSIPIDLLHKQGFKEIPEKFFEYAKDVFNGFHESEFENENLPAEKTPIIIESYNKPKKHEIKQGKFGFYKNIDVLKLPCDYE